MKKIKLSLLVNVFVFIITFVLAGFMNWVYHNAVSGSTLESFSFHFSNSMVIVMSISLLYLLIGTVILFFKVKE